jgi:hypothetical protein
VTGWTTREAAEKCGLSQHTLRWYERIGLLDRVSRTADGRRRFSDADLDWLLLRIKLAVRNVQLMAGAAFSVSGQGRGVRYGNSSGSQRRRAGLR